MEKTITVDEDVWTFLTMEKLARKKKSQKETLREILIETGAMKKK